MCVLQIRQRRKFWGIPSLLEVRGSAYVIAISSLVLTDRDPFTTGFNLRFPVVLPQGFLIPLSLIGEGRGEVK